MLDYTTELIKTIALYLGSGIIAFEPNPLDKLNRLLAINFDSAPKLKLDIDYHYNNVIKDSELLNAVIQSKLTKKYFTVVKHSQDNFSEFYNLQAGDNELIINLSPLELYKDYIVAYIPSNQIKIN